MCKSTLKPLKQGKKVHENYVDELKIKCVKSV